MTFWTLIGLGSNNVEITSLIFGSKETALETLIPLFGEPNLKKRDPYDKDSLKVLFWEAPSFENEKGEDGNYHNSELVKKFYTNYYGGCGECWAFILVEVEEGKPFAQFDLD
jgi:hypothetical protein